MKDWAGRRDEGESAQILEAASAGVGALTLGGIASSPVSSRPQLPPQKSSSSARERSAAGLRSISERWALRDDDRAV